MTWIFPGGTSAAGAGNPVVSGAVDVGGNLILTLDDGTTVNCGVVFDGTGNPVTSGLVNGAGELVLTLQDGSQINAGVVTPDISGDLDGKVDKVPGKQLSTEDFTSALLAKLNDIAVNATANSTDAELRDRATHTGTQPINTIDSLQNELDSKVDKVAGKQLSTEDYTTPEKTKLANLPADAEANIPYIVADHAMTAGVPIEKTLTNNQTRWDLRAFAFKEEPPTIASAEQINAVAQTTQLSDTSSETLTATAEGSVFSITPSDQVNGVDIAAGAMVNAVQTPMTSTNDLGQVVSIEAGSKAGGGAIYNAFNGVEGSDYSGNGGPVMAIGSALQIDLGSEKSFSQYRFYRTDGGGYSYKTNQWELLGSNDGTNFDVLDTVTLSTSDPDWYEGVIGAQSYRYIRINLIAGNSYCTVGELELMGSTNAVLIESGGNYYTILNNALAPVAAPTSPSDIINTGATQMYINKSIVAGIAPYKIMSATGAGIDLTYKQALNTSLAIAGTDISAASYIGSVTLTTTDGQVFVQVDGIHHSYSTDWTAYGAELSQVGGNMVQPMTANSSVGQVATASSAYAGYEPFEAFNGTYSGYSDSWLSSGNATPATPEWIAIDLGQIVTITGYVVRNQNYSTPYPATDWIFEGSNDGTNWDVLHTVVNDTSDLSDSGLRSYLDLGVFSYRHYRLSVTAGPSGLVSFSDIQLISPSYDIATDGNTAAELEALTSTQWAALYPSGLTNIAFSYQSSSDLTGATATVNLETGDSGSPSAWIQCDTAACAIRWYEDKVTFTAAQDGNYKLAYQDSI